LVKWRTGRGGKKKEKTREKSVNTFNPGAGERIRKK